MNLINKPYHLCFETFANELRMKIMKELLKKPMHVEELTAAVGVERSRVSHSLQMLRTCNLVETKKEGKRMIYMAKEHTFFHNKGTGILAIIDNHIDHHCHQCGKMKGGSQ